MALRPRKVEESGRLWPVAFADVEEAQLRAALAATPAQRLAWAEELMEFARIAAAARAAGTPKPD